MKVAAVWEFEVDTDELDPKFVDIFGLAKDLTRRELGTWLSKGDLSEEDFEYLVKGEENYAEWETRTKSFDTGIAFISEHCSNCGNQCHIESTRSDALGWYLSNIYKPKRPKFCSECGREMKNPIV